MMVSPLIKSIPDDAIDKQQGDPAMACVVFGLRKCRSRMATVNSSVLVPYLSDSIEVMLAKSNCTRLCML